MEQKMFYERPTQVVFADPDEPGAWITGIAYRDEIICACCGGVYSLEDLIEMGIEDGVTKSVYEYSYWVDLVSEISGGELPEGLTLTENGITEIQA